MPIEQAPLAKARPTALPVLLAIAGGTAVVAGLVIDPLIGLPGITHSVRLVVRDVLILFPLLSGTLTVQTRHPRSVVRVVVWAMVVLALVDWPLFLVANVMDAFGGGVPAYLDPYLFQLTPGLILTFAGGGCIFASGWLRRREGSTLVLDDNGQAKTGSRKHVSPRSLWSGAVLAAFAGGVVVAAIGHTTVPADEVGGVVRYPVATPGSNPLSIATTPDGALWFSENAANKIGRITTDGRIREFSLPPSSDLLPAGDIVAGPDRAVWFPDGKNTIGRMTADGELTTFHVPVDGGGGIDAVFMGPDGRLWYGYTTYDANGDYVVDGVAKWMPGGTPTSYVISAANAWPESYTVGPDRAIWFVESVGGRIGKITTSGRVTEYPIPPTVPCSMGPTDISTGPGNHMWFTCEHEINRVSLTGIFTHVETVHDFATPSLLGTITDHSGALWIEDDNSNIIRLTPCKGSFATTIYPVSGINPSIGNLVFGSDGGLWFPAGNANTIDRMTVAPPGCAPND